MAAKTFHEKQVEDADEKQRIFEQTIAELQNEERFKEYFNKYSEDSVKGFIKYYANLKAQWFSSGENMVNYRDSQDNRWTDNAWMVLNHIQHKKFFNLECKWRAEQVKAEGIEISMDFYFRKKSVLDSPLIDPVSEEELNLYIAFLQQLSDTIPFDDYNIGNDYGSLKDGFFKVGEHYSEYPPWYAFYDEHYGTDILLSLPDIRGDKEQVYMDLWREEKKPQWDAMNAGRDKRPIMPSLHDKNFAEWFLKEFETKETLTQYYHTKQWNEKHERIEDIEMDIYILQEADRDVPLEDDDDWRTGIKRGAEKYYRERTIEALPEIWKTYRQRIAAGKSAMPKDKITKDEKASDNKSRNEYVQYILRGRELKGEPRDLNF